MRPTHLALRTCVLAGLYSLLAGLVTAQPAPDFNASLRTSPTGALSLRWSSQAGLKYHIESSPDLVTWTAQLGSFVGDGNELSPIVRPAGAIDPARQFWRVIGGDPDTDSDGLADWEEALYGTSPTVADSDGDGRSDGWEVNYGRDPRVADPTGGDAGPLPPAVAPAITTQPLSTSVPEGATATFSVTATGTPTPIYQWLKDGSPINSARSPNYTTPPSTEADNGAVFSVVVTNPSGRIESSAATLQVSPAGITHGSQINECNTGVPAGHALAEVASTIIVTEAWIRSSNGGSRAIRNRHFLSGAGLVISVDGFTVQYCRFSGVGGFTTNANDGRSSLGKNIQILDCEFDGNHENGGGDVAVGGSDLTLKRVWVHRWPRAMWVGEGNIWVEECYMHDLTVDGSGAHIENIYVAGGANQTYVRNKLISNRVPINGGTAGISASLAIYNEGWAPFPDLDHILVENNYFESDGGYAIYGGACVSKLPKPYAKNTVVRGNIFGRGIQRRCGVYGTSTAFDPAQPGNLWEGNTWGPPGPFWQAGDPVEGASVAAPGPS